MAQALNQLSDDDLIKLASQHGIPVPKPAAPAPQAGGLESMSDDDLIKLAQLHGIETPPAQNSVLQSALKQAPNLNDTADKLKTASRAGLSSMSMGLSEPAITAMADKLKTASRAGLSSMSMGLSEPAITAMDAIPKFIENPNREYSIQGLKDAYNQAAADNLASKNRNPEAQTIGSIAGALSPEGAIAKGMGLIGGAVQGLVPAGKIGAGLVGAAQGAGSGALNYGQQAIEKASGTSDKEPDSLASQLAGGGVVGGVGGVVGNILENSASKLTDFAQSKAAKSIGFMKKDLPKSKSLGYNAARQKELDIGQAAMDEGLITPGANVHSIAEKSDDLLSKYMKQIKSFYKDASQQLNSLTSNPNTAPEAMQALDAITVKPKQLANDLSEKIIQDLNKQHFPPEEQEPVLKKVGNWINKLKTFPDGADIEDLNRYRMSLDKSINWSAKELPMAQDYLKDIRTGLVNHIQQRLENVASNVSPNKAEEIRSLNKSFGKMADIARISKDRALTLEFANRGVSPSDYLTGGAGLITGGLLGAEAGHSLESGLKGAAVGAAAGLVNKAARTYGNPLMTSGVAALAPQMQGLGQLVKQGSARTAGLLSSKGGK